MRRLDLLLVALWVVCICLTLPFENATPAFVRSITGALMIGSLLYAAYRMVSALFSERFDPVLNIALAIGLFVGVTLCLGLFLNFTAWGIVRPMWMLGYGAITLVMIVVTFAADRHFNAVITGWTISPSRLLTLMVIGGLFASAYWVARTGLEQQVVPGFTDFWLMGDQAAPADSLEVGVISHENQGEFYRVELVAGDTVLQTWDDIALAPGAAWQMSITLPLTDITDPVVGQLYRTSDTKPYRRVEFWSGNTGNR